MTSKYKPLKTFSISWLFLLFTSLIVLTFPAVSRAGCCECYPDYKINGQSSRQCFGGEQNNAFLDFNMCEIFCTYNFPNYSPPQGYPSFSNLCEAGTNCPSNSKSCCIYIDSYTEKIKKCTSNLTKLQCAPITKYVEGKTCEEMNCEGYIGRSLNAMLPTEYTPPAEEPPAEPVYFVPQVTIPGSITIAGKEFRISKGVGIEITGATAAQYFAVFYRFFVAALAVIAIVMVMWGGFKRIMAAGSPEAVKSANETILGAITGVVIALLSYSLLSLVNPALVQLKPLVIEPIKKESIDFISSADYQTITGSVPYKPFDADMIEKMKAAAKSAGIHYCVLHTIFQKESGARVDAVGYDENVNNSNASKIPSRVRFVETDKCKQYISQANASDCQLQGGAKNDDRRSNINVNRDDLGMDWRYSRGFGVGQITIFPSWHRLHKTCNGVPCITINGKDYKPKELFDLDTNLEAIVNLWKSDKCPGEVTMECFKRYNGSTDYGVDAIAIYNSCMKNNP